MESEPEMAPISHGIKSRNSRESGAEAAQNQEQKWQQKITWNPEQEMRPYNIKSGAEMAQDQEHKRHGIRSRNSTE